ncbi:serine/threonine-protein kinase SRK2I-like isoform 1 [Hibiscus syriacus]|uniref:Serine/threonine-protein kinase SRK2I-like isoform 1 n=1 Tax=Hibiscus syriacus TaxID=106335 RepID=A0A6A2ZUV9_HIBSY|nr:serine/threonine-protein kinase SRK2I-like isoform 1 [Hibiscus syriacus]
MPSNNGSHSVTEMVLDSELIARLWEFLDESDLNTTTTAIVRRRLEQDFGIDLTDRKKFIREQVDLSLQNQFENAKEQQEQDYQTDKIKSEETDGSDSDDAEEETERARNKRASSIKRLLYNDFLSKLHQALDVLQTSFFTHEPIICFVIFVNNNWYCTTRVAGPVKSLEKEKPWKHEREEVKSMEKEKPRNHERDEAPSIQILLPTQDSKKLPPFFCMHMSQHLRGCIRSDPDEEKQRKKRQKGFLAPLQLSDALVKFLGTGENELTRASVIKRMLDYIKENNFQDPSDKRKVICDEKLKELFDVETFHGFTVTKLLAAHFLKS